MNMEYMEFKEVENINKGLIVKIKDRINLKELVPYMESWGFTKMVIQGIEREMLNHGESYAVVSFMDAVKKRPKSFPKLVAALRHLKREEVESKVMQEIRKYFRNNQTRLAQVISLIEAEEKELSEDHQDDSGSHSMFASGNGALQQGLSTGNNDTQPSKNAPTRDDWSQDTYRGDSHPPSRDPPKKEQPKPQPWSATSMSSPDNNTPGATGTAGPGQAQPLSSDTPASLDPSYADKCISSLKANVYRALGKALHNANTHEDDDEPWWNYLIDYGDLDISREEQRKIERHKTPGVEFLDILGDRHYTLRQLERLFTQFRINEALDILLRHQNKVIEGRHPVQNENNLNRNQEAKADQEKTLNISLPQTDGPGPEERNTLSIQPSSEQSRQSEVHSTTRFSDVSLDSNTDYSLQSIKDEPVKGTTAVEAHGDPTGKQSQPNPEQDAQKLRNDRVSQFDIDPEALENTSFIPLDRQQRESTNNVRGNIPVLPGDNGDQMGSGSILQSNIHVEGDGNTRPAPVEQGESTGNIPLLSQFGSVDSSIGDQSGDQPEDQIVRHEGVANVSPRSFTTNEAMSTDVPNTTGVTYVPASLSTMSSREVTTDDSNLQSGAVSNVTSLDSLKEPDIEQDTRLESQTSDDGNVTFD